MKTPQYVFCIGAGDDQIPYLEIIKEMGFRIVTVDRNGLAPGFSLSDEHAVISTHDYDGILEYVRSLPKSIKLHRVFSFATGYPQLVAVKIAAFLGLPHSPESAIKSILDKAEFRLILEDLNLPTIPFALVSNYPEAIKASSKIDFPQIFKPATGGMGSIGVSRVDSERDARAAFERATDSSNNGTVLIEKFIEGIHLSYTGLIVGGRWKYTALGKKLIHPEGRFIPVGAAQGFQPAEQHLNATIDQHFKSMASRLGFEQSTLRADVIYDPVDELAYFIEMEIVLATPLLLAPVSHGYDLLKNIVKTVLFQDVKKAGDDKYGATVLYFMHPSQNFSRIDNATELIDNESIIELNFDTQKYQYEIDGVTHYVWGRVVTRDENRSESIKTATMVQNQLKYEYD
jgi:biotin carboxylase